MNKIIIAQDTELTATAEEIGQAMELLSTSLPYREAGSGELRTMAYLSALSGVTRYGLSKATQAALKGEHGSTFYPSTAEFLALYKAAMQPVADQKAAERKAADEARQIAERNAPKPEPFDAGTIRGRSWSNSEIARVLYGTPAGRRYERAKTDMRGCTVIKEGVTLQEFKGNGWGEGARYSPLLETVFRR